MVDIENNLNKIKKIFQIAQNDELSLRDIDYYDEQIKNEIETILEKYNEVINNRFSKLLEDF